MPPARRNRRDDEDLALTLQQRSQIDAADPDTATDESEEDDAEEEEAGSRSNADQKLATKLVRYAISCEHSRTTIKRDGIKEKVLGANGRSFQRIFSLAQTQLRQIWGMELRELPVREKMTVNERRQAMKANTQPKVGSGSYILTSTLPKPMRGTGVLKPSFAPSARDESVYMGFYTLIVCVIWLTGGELSEQKLKRHLQRLNADRNVDNERTEIMMKKMEKHSYVIRRVEKGGAGQDGDAVTTWHIGPRAREEIGLEGVMDFAREVYGESIDDLEKKLRASLGIREQ